VVAVPQQHTGPGIKLTEKANGGDKKRQKKKRKIMGYSAGFLNHLIQVLNRKEATGNKFGLDGAGIEWENGDILHANVTYAKGTRAMNAGALDVYAVNEVRMRWTNKISMRSRVRYQGKIWQIIPETFHEDFQEDKIQFHMQLVINDQ
jgi:head-tail adaptor